MSSKNFRVLHPKSVYNNLEFHKEPYSTSQQFNVFIPKEEDYVTQMIEKDMSLTKSKKFFTINARTASAPIIQFSQGEKDALAQVEVGDSNYQQQITQKQRGKFLADIETANNYASDYIVQPQTAKAPVIAQSLHITEPIKSILKMQISPKMNYSVKTFRTSTDFKQAKIKQMDRLRQSLYFDEVTKSIPKSTIRNTIIEDIVSDGDIFISKKGLMNSIHKLKQLKLLKNHDDNVNRFPGIGKINFVYNDYHTKSTNNGFSRNFGGVFYTR